MALLGLITIVGSAQEKYPLTKEGNSYICKGTEPCKLDDKSTFGSIALWALNHVDNTAEKPMKCDVKQLLVSMYCSVTESDEADRVYTFNLCMGVDKGNIVFLIKDIKCAPKGVLAVFKTITFDKLNLTKKPQNKEYVDKFAILCDQYMQQILTTILSSNLKITHWDAIVAGKVEKGMIPDEVILAKGKPIAVTENSQRIMWNYESGAIVMIENGKVSGVIN